jgi:hypothetical protein
MMTNTHEGMIHDDNDSKPAALQVVAKSVKWLHCSSIDDTMLDNIQGLSNQVDSLRKVIQTAIKALDPDVGFGLVDGSNAEDIPLLGVAKTQELVLQHVADEKLRGFLLSILKKELVMAISIRRGLLYASCNSSQACWFLPYILECGFGSSHSMFPFQNKEWQAIRNLARDKDMFDMSFILGWMSSDGSILDYRNRGGCFECLLPIYENSGVVELFDELYHRLFGIDDVCKYVKVKYSHSKPIMGFRVAKKAQRSTEDHGQKTVACPLFAH